MPFTSWLEWLRPSPRWEAVTFWALDLELTGLDVRCDRILSVGMVPIRQGVIRYGERFESLVSVPVTEGASMNGIGAHHILPRETRSAPGIDAVLRDIDDRLRGAVLLLHFARLDLAFLRAAYRRARASWPRPPVVDTWNLAVRLHDRQHRWTPHPPSARTSLPAARDALGLPAYPHHDALSDAVATAELFLVLRSRLGLCTLRSLHN